MNRFAPSARQLNAMACAAALTCFLSGCSTLEESKIDYKSASQAPTLSVPPDLTQLKRDSRYQVAGSNSALASAASTAAPSRVLNDAGTAANQAGEARIVRAGTQRYLVINKSADAVWEPLREFWKDNGFVLNLDQAELGIMETDWAENRAKLPQDFLRKPSAKCLTLSTPLASVIAFAPASRERPMVWKSPSPIVAWLKFIPVP